MPSAPRFVPDLLRRARQDAKLTQFELASRLLDLANDPDTKTRTALVLRLRAWEARVGSWERGIEAPSVRTIPLLAQALGVGALDLFADVDQSAPNFTALRMAAGITLTELAELSGTSYSTLQRMVRGLTAMPDPVAALVATALGVSVADVRSAIARQTS